MDNKIKPIKVIFCLPGSSFTHNFLKSFIATISYCIKNNITISVRNNVGSNIFSIREEMLNVTFNKKTKKLEIFDGEDYDYIFWVDSDMKWKPEDFISLFEANKDIVTGACIKEGGEFAASHFIDENNNIFTPKLNGNEIKEKFTIKNFFPNEIEEYKEPISISACGFAFILIKKGVFEKIGPPWFMQVYRIGEQGFYTYFSEDYSFSVRAKNAGFQIWLQPKAIIGHQKNVVLYP